MSDDCGDGCGCHSGGDGDAHQHVAPGTEREDGPADPRVHPERSPGFGDAGPDGLEDIEVERDVEIGAAEPGEFAAADTEPVENDDPTALRTQALEGDVVERRRAVLELGDRRPTDATIDALSRAIREDPDGDVRQFAVESLGSLGDDRGLAAVHDACRDDDPWVRAEAVVALDGIDRAGQADRLDALRSDDHHAVRRNAMIALCKLRGEAMADTLLEHLEDPSPRVREWAAQFLGDIDDDRARDALRVASRTDDSQIVRVTATKALADELRAGHFDAGDDPTESGGYDPLNDQPDL